MKLLDKFKNIFTEEVEEEVKIEPVSVKAKKEKTPDVIDSFDEVKIEKEEVKKPVFFTDSDFDDLEKKLPKRIEKEQPKVGLESRSSYRSSFSENKIDSEPKKEIYRGNQTNVYNDPYKPKKEERVFKPTPIISPVYGILDKNYHKEDIVSKKDVNYGVSESSNTIDSVRKKAYGTLEDELENTLFGSNSILFNKKEDENNNTDDFFNDLEKESKPDLMNNFDDEIENEDNKKIRDLEEITMDIGKELNSLLNKKESIKKVEKEEDDDLFNLIDTMYEGDE